MSSIRELIEELSDDDISLVSFRLTCLDCEHEVIGYTDFGFDPNIKFECSACGSRNTERD